MSAALALITPTPETLEQRLKEKLSSLGFRLKVINMSQLTTWIVKRDALFIKSRHGQPFCLISERSAGVLLGNHPQRECPMTLSGFRTSSKAIPTILNCRAFDVIAVSYAAEEFAVAMDAALFLERLR